VVDAYGTFGTWKLDDFEPGLNDWFDREHPPSDLFEQVQAWWPRLEHSSERTHAHPATDEATADGGGEDNVFVILVPGCSVPDESKGMLRALCIFQVFEVGHRVVCRAFHTVRSTAPAEVDRADGMG
jgi:hypothetical protein